MKAKILISHIREMFADDLIEGIKKHFNTEKIFLDQEEYAINFNQNSIILTPKTNKTYLIEIRLHEKEYYVIKKFANYDICYHYDYNGKCYFSTAHFKIKSSQINPEYLVIEELSDYDYYYRRLFISEERKDLYESDQPYERSHALNKILSTKEKMNFSTAYDGHQDIRKILKYQKNANCYFNKNYYDYFFGVPLRSHIELAAVTGNPRMQIEGRQINNDLYFSSLRIGCPNIFIRGNYIDQENASNNILYSIKIYKKNNTLYIVGECICINDDSKIQTFEKEIPSDNVPNLTVQDIEKITNEFFYKIFYHSTNRELTKHIIEEIAKIKNIILEINGQQLNNVDAIDVNMEVIKNFEEWCYSVYSNLAEYVKLLKENALEENQSPKLNKIAKPSI